jgi:tetratricopeptide (TPR) repeat protein
MFGACSSDHAGHYENYINQAIKYENEKKYEKAITSINLSLKIDSTKSFPYVLRGKILSLMHSDGAAILDFSKAIQLNPKNISAYFNKAISLSLLDNDDSAIFYFNQAIKMKEFGDFILEKKNSNFPDLESQNDISLSSIRFHRGLSLYSKKNDSLAMEDFNIL